MNNKLLATIIVACGLVVVPVHDHAAEPHGTQQAVKLSPDLMSLLAEEMREIAAGVQGIALSLATADWGAIVETSEKIQASYILDKKLTMAQSRELEHALPVNFRELDAEFHRRAEKLGAAASAHDFELVAFHYSRLIESCARCHSAYARQRFPGFSPSGQPGHHH